MNFVVADHSLSLEQVINMPFALGTYARKYPNAEGAIATMMGSRIRRANREHKSLIKELVTACGLEEQKRAVAYLNKDAQVLMYLPKHLEVDNPNDLITPELVVAIARQEYVNPNDTLYVVDPITISFWEHPITNRLPGWTTRGRYYGYPQCCIEAFLERVRAHHRGDFNKFSEIGTRSQGYPCIVCEAHANVPAEEVTELITQNRHCPLTMENDDEPSPDDRFTIELSYLLALQQGKLTPHYDLEDPVS